MPTLRASRPAAIAVAFLVLFVGLAVRKWTGGAFAKYAGVALYGTLIYTLTIAIAPRLSPWRAAAIALAFCWAIEFGQLSSIPASLAKRSMLARVVLGTTFNAPDLFWYAVGIAPVAAADGGLRDRDRANRECHSHLGNTCPGSYQKRLRRTGFRDFETRAQCEKGTAVSVIPVMHAYGHFPE